MPFTEAENAMIEQVQANAAWLEELAAEVLRSPMTRADAIGAPVCAMAAATGFDREATKEIVYRNLSLGSESMGEG